MSDPKVLRSDRPPALISPPTRPRLSTILPGSDSTIGRSSGALEIEVDLRDLERSTFHRRAQRLLRVALATLFVVGLVLAAPLLGLTVP